MFYLCSLIKFLQLIVDQAAVADLGKANSVSPDDETIADALR